MALIRTLLIPFRLPTFVAEDTRDAAMGALVAVAVDVPLANREVVVEVVVVVLGLAALNKDDPTVLVFFTVVVVVVLNPVVVALGRAAAPIEEVVVFVTVL